MELVGSGNGQTTISQPRRPAARSLGPPRSQQAGFLRTSAPTRPTAIEKELSSRMIRRVERFSADVVQVDLLVIVTLRFFPRQIFGTPG